ncbi:hypothetical protein L0Y65_01925 [Candidatus Micrarchaeota archaeon]|nr:hypothetical protein [Candidatus Micrarchaeota archaeon]
MADTTYRDIDGQNEGVAAESAKRFPSECALMEEAVAASLSLFGTISRNAAGLDARRQDLLAFFYRNSIYLSASYHLIRRGLLDPAGNNMRTVFETILWQYAYLTDDGIYANYREMARMDGDKLKLLKDGKWSNTKERALENLRRKYSFQKMMKELYSKESYEKLFYSQYWAFCQKSHSSTFGINHNTPNMEGGMTFGREGDAEEVRGNLRAALYLCAENLICFLNCFAGILGQETIDETLAVANRINRLIPPSPGLAPDTKKLPFVLRFREV